jgi:hypothetical protein
MRCDASAPFRSFSRAGMPLPSWTLDAKKLKRYPHFDGDIPIPQAEALANNPKRIASHTFYPFLLFNQNWTRYADNGEAGEKKTRPIRYAARADAYIFAKYRHELAQFYERELSNSCLTDSILAYRKIFSPGGGGMCNIHFAKAAFDEVICQGNCCVIALDISSFFESLDHAKLKEIWTRLLGVEKLPSDHFRVFQSVTRYSVIEKQAAFERLGYFGPKRTLKSGKIVPGYLLPKTAKLRRLCTGSDFRLKIAGGDGRPNLIQTNLKTHGIPQGSPISDLLANMYLIDFDKEIMDIVTKINGRYLRYSDDILIIAPIPASDACSLEKEIRSRIKAHGRKLVMKSKKSYILEFYKNGTHQNFAVVFDGQSASECVKRTIDDLNRKKVPLNSIEGKHALDLASKNARKSLNGLEYLGFRYDGRKAYLRDSTLSNLWRRIKRSARRKVHSYARANPAATAVIMKAKFDYDDFTKRYGRVEDFEKYAGDYQKWTFWTYAQRSSKIFGPIGSPILRQLKDHRQKIKVLVEAEIDRIMP